MSDQTAAEYLLIYDPEFEADSIDFKENFGLNAKTEAVRNTADLISVAGKYTLVKYLEIDLHGSPGMLHCASGGAMMGTYFGGLINSANMLCSGARVLFLGCNVAQGTAGDKFLVDVGKAMFKGLGGTVGASTVLNISTHDGEVFFKRIHLWEIPFDDARLKTCRFDVDGEEIGAQEIDRWGSVKWSWSNVPTGR